VSNQGTSSLERFPDIDPTTTYDLIVGGQEVPAKDGETFSCVDPYDDVEWGQVADASAADVDRAVRSAQDAFPSWRDTSAAQRQSILTRWSELIAEHTPAIARLQVHENGKTITENRMALGGAARMAVTAAHLGMTLQGAAAQPLGPNFDAWTRHEPLGVVAAITPWNNPLSLLANKLFPALAAGNSVVIKPSEVTPVSTLALVRLGIEAGLPDGVVNVVTGAGRTGAALAEHPGIAKVAFTGSTATGRKIAQAVAARFVLTSFELGGKGPNIVFADAKLDDAVAGLVTGMAAGAGQACNAGPRILLEAPVYDEVIEKLIAELARLRIGDPLDPEVDMGPLASRAQYQKVCDYLDIAAQEGHTRLAGGRRGREVDQGGHGLFVEPTLYQAAGGRSRLMQEEIFGPVAGAVRFETEEEAVALANGVDYGLVAGFWTQNLARGHRLVSQLDAGTVWVNTWRMFSQLLPFGGFKDSGVGHEMGLDAVAQYTRTKATFLNFG
jgi:aldehyde dehydrogenase (NAD+)